MITSLILNELPGRWGGLRAFEQANDDKRTLKDFIVRKVLEKVDLKLPKITDKELKQAVLSRMADNAIEKMKED
jgi:hypothetical protein